MLCHVQQNWKEQSNQAAAYRGIIQRAPATILNGDRLTNGIRNDHLNRLMEENINIHLFPVIFYWIHKKSSQLLINESKDKTRHAFPTCDIKSDQLVQVYCKDITIWWSKEIFFWDIYEVRASHIATTHKN